MVTRLDITLKETGVVPSRRARNRIFKEGHEAAGRFWHEELLPEHFKPNARFRYGHKRRTRRYLAKKRALAKRGIVERGGEVDNVYTGLMEDTLTSIAVVKPFPKRVTIKMQGPRYITMRPFTSNQPDKAAELTKTTRPEERRIGKVMDKTITEEFNGLRETKTTRI